MFIQFRLPALQDIYPVSFARTVLASPRTIEIGRRDTTRAERQQEQSGELVHEMYKIAFPYASIEVTS